MFINFGLLSKFRVIIWSRSATLVGLASASFSHGKGQITKDIMGLTPASCGPYKCTSLLDPFDNPQFTAAWGALPQFTNY